MLSPTVTVVNFVWWHVFFCCQSCFPFSWFDCRGLAIFLFFQRILFLMNHFFAVWFVLLQIWSLGLYSEVDSSYFSSFTGVSWHLSSPISCVVTKYLLLEKFALLMEAQVASRWCILFLQETVRFYETLQFDLTLMSLFYQKIRDIFLLSAAVAHFQKQWHL